MTKALFFDIDGTLVSFNTHRIPQSTIEALEAAHAKGIKIFIATGRPKSIIGKCKPWRTFVKKRKFPVSLSENTV
jgi:HAD superfamily hydrolase (TIGR01484 family)